MITRRDALKLGTAGLIAPAAAGLWVPSLKAIAGETNLSERERDVDTSETGLARLLPDPTIVPTGFVLSTEDWTSDFETVVRQIRGTSAGTREAEKNLIDWGWTASISRSFHSTTSVTDSGTFGLVVDIHGFRDGTAANAALNYFADYHASRRTKESEVKAPALGENSRMQSGPDGTGLEAVWLFVQKGPVLYIFVGYAFSGGDPTQDVVDFARQTLAS